MKPELEAYNMMVESLVCLSNDLSIIDDVTADPELPSLIKDRLDFEEELNKFEHPIDNLLF